MEATDKNLFNNDVVLRLGALVFTGALAYCVNLYLEEKPNHYNGYFISLILSNLAVLWLALVCIKTAFSQDVKELAVFELLYLIVIYALYLLSRINPTQFLDLYHSISKYQDLFLRLTYVIFVARIFWPCKNKDSSEYANWPIFGFIGLYFKILKIEHRFAPPTVRQAVLAYGTILAACVIGFILWRNGVKNAMITQAVPAIAILGYACIKSKALLTKRIAEYHEKKAEADRIKEQARIAEAAAASLAEANAQLQAAIAKFKKIIAEQMDIFAQAQDDHAKERARLAVLEAAIERGQGTAADAGLLAEILNPDNPHYSIRLVACVKMFEYFQGKVITGKSAKDAIVKYAMEHAGELGLLHKGEPSQNAADQCAFVLNWIHEAGAPRTQARPA
jgi:hypothetical protein